MAMEDRFVATMILGAVGDAVGFRGGRWEFLFSGITMFEELQSVTKGGGMEQLCVEGKEWPVSDDTLLHMATAEGLLTSAENGDHESFLKDLANKYVKSMNSEDMRHRAPGNTCIAAGKRLRHALGHKAPLIGEFDKRGGGSGAAMRSMCIGLVYNREDQTKQLLAASIDSGRLTHHHPTGYLGSLASALFTAFAIQGKPLREWGKGLMNTLVMARAYIIDQGLDVQTNVNEMQYFEDKWKTYLDKRSISDGKSEASFPSSYGLYERDEFYRSLSFDGTGGASGHDAAMIAYDALLGIKTGDWNELCLRSMIHGGDSDTTGTIAGALYGAINGFDGVPKLNYSNIEYKERLVKLGKRLYQLSEKFKKEVDVKGQPVEKKSTPV